MKVNLLRLKELFSIDCREVLCKCQDIIFVYYENILQNNIILLFKIVYWIQTIVLIYIVNRLLDDFFHSFLAYLINTLYLRKVTLKLKIRQN